MQAAVAATFPLVSPPPARHDGRCRSPWRRTAPIFSIKPALLNSTPYLQWRCHAISKTIKDQNGTRVDIQQKDKEDIESMEEKIKKIKQMLSTMGDGEISISPYDTAWVALIPNVDGHSGPQFPSSLQWIIDHQLDDGSWGDAEIFHACDRILNTLSCVIALNTWGSSPDQYTKGIKFIQSNMHKLGDERIDHFPIGFELSFPPLIEMARNLRIDIPYENPTFQVLEAMRGEKLKRIPLDVLHNVTTSLLYSLEGMTNLLDWKKLIKLKCLEGSLLFSPASTACAVMNTNDESCIKYLENIVSKFDGGAPNVYPVDLFEHMWSIDRLQRLGISRYFEHEIKKNLEYIFNYWTDNGIGWARNSSFQDVDDTSMGFQILRIHGYDVKPDVFEQFHKGNEFVCCPGQSSQAITGIYNLNRATQVAFPGEMILEDAKHFSYRFLRDKQERNELFDKWIITKDLPGEVSYTLDYPWIMSLPRVEARTYLDQYGGHDDVWIGKTLYRMLYVNNNTYLELAKSDFNHCQAFLQEDWIKLRKWFIQYELAQYGVNTKRLLEIYFLAASTFFEPERSHERLSWAQTAMLAEALYSYMDKSDDQTLLENLCKQFQNATNNSTRLEKYGNDLIEVIMKTIDDISIQAVISMKQKQGIISGNHDDIDKKQQHIKKNILLVWYDWMHNISKEGIVDSRDEEGLLFVRILELCAGRFFLEEALSHSLKNIASDVLLDYRDEDTYRMSIQQCLELTFLTKSIYHNLLHKKYTSQQLDVRSKEDNISLQSEIQKLTKCVLDDHSLLDINTRQTFLTVIRSFYYASHCSPCTMNIHIGKIIFEKVE